VFGIAGRRVAEALVALFALLGFVFVPLGQKTAFQHAVAVFSTPAAAIAFHELTGAVLRLKDRVSEAIAPAPTPEADRKLIREVARNVVAETVKTGLAPA